MKYGVHWENIIVLPYIIVYLVCGAIVFIADKGKNDSKYAKCLLILSVIIISLFAGIRNTKVGTDVQIYIEKYYNAAKSSNGFFDYLRMYSNESVEILYKCITYISAKISNDVHFLLFVSRITTSCSV